MFVAELFFKLSLFQLDVIHLQFTSWPDHGVPKTPKDMLGWCDDLNTFPSNPVSFSLGYKILVRG